MKGKIVITIIISFLIGYLFCYFLHYHIEHFLGKPIENFKSTNSDTVLKTFWVKNPKVNIRSEPNQNSKIICQLSKGDKVTPIEEKQGWTKISFNYGKIGWVSSTLLSENYIKPLPEVEIIDISSKEIFSTNAGAKYSWKLVIRNNKNIPISIDAIIKYFDSDDFVIETDNEYDLYVNAGQTKTFTGTSVIPSSGVGRIRKTGASIEW